MPAQTVRRDYTIKVSPMTDFGLGNGTYGQPFSVKLVVAGGQPPYTSTLVEGKLPVGLTYDPATKITTIALEGLVHR